MNISPFFSGYLFGWIFKMFFSYFGCIFIIRVLDLDIFSYSFPVLGFLLGLMNYKLSQNYLQHTVPKLSESRNIRVIFFIAMWFLVATVAFLLFVYTMSILSISSNYRLSMNWFLLFISLPFGAIISGYAQFLEVSHNLSSRSMIICGVIGLVTIFTLYLLGVQVNKQNYSGLIETPYRLENSQNTKLDPDFERAMGPLLRAGVEEDWGDKDRGNIEVIKLSQIFHSDDGKISVKFPEGKIDTEVNEKDNTSVYLVELGTYAQKDYIMYAVTQLTYRLPVHLKEGGIPEMVENFANIFIGVSNTSQLKENALLGNAIVDKIHDNRFWFRQNVLFNDTAYVFEGILRVEGNKDHMIVTSILYPITTNPNTEEFFDSFQFHTTPTKPGISTKSSQGRSSSTNNSVVTSKPKTSISGEVAIRSSSISGEMLIR